MIIHTIQTKSACVVLCHQVHVYLFVHVTKLFPGTGEHIADVHMTGDSKH